MISPSSLEAEHLPTKKLGQLSIIVPTYREAANLRPLIERIDSISVEFEALELLIMDDNSQDGTEELIQNLNIPWVRLIVRRQNRGLSPAVIDGLRLAKFDQICVMDADLSHPPEKIPEMIRRLREPNTDMVVGSRYIDGGQIDQEWSWFRHFNSQFATWLARPFTTIKDPMSGFFALHNKIFLQAQDLNPIGYKIGLELIVKGRAERVKEIPILFVDRIQGESKLTLKEQLNYIRHLKRLLDYKFGNISYFLQFGFSGTLGLVSNISLLNLFIALGVSLEWSVDLAIGLSMIVTFLGNRWITFNHGLKTPWINQFVSFVLASALGAFINRSTTLNLVNSMAISPTLAAIAGCGAGMVSNFLFSRYLIFRKNIHVRNSK